MKACKIKPRLDFSGNNSLGNDARVGNPGGQFMPRNLAVDAAAPQRTKMPDKRLENELRLLRKAR